MSTQLSHAADDHGSTPALRPLEIVDRSSTAEQARAAQSGEIVQRLSDRYTREQISVVDLKARVNGFYGQFDGARLRGFVAVLVEGLVRRSIAGPTHSPELF